MSLKENSQTKPTIIFKTNLPVTKPPMKLRDRLIPKFSPDTINSRFAGPGVPTMKMTKTSNAKKDVMKLSITKNRAKWKTEV